MGTNDTSNQLTFHNIFSIENIYLFQIQVNRVKETGANITKNLSKLMVSLNFNS